MGSLSLITGAARPLRRVLTIMVAIAWVRGPQARSDKMVPIHERGGHGFGLYQKETTSTKWFDAFAHWFGTHGFLTPRAGPVAAMLRRKRL